MNKDYAFCHCYKKWHSLAGDINRQAISLGRSFVSDSVTDTDYLSPSFVSLSLYCFLSFPPQHS